MPTCLALQVYGDEAYLAEARLLLLSAIKQGVDNRIRFKIYTDNVGYWADFQPYLNISTVQLTPEKIKEWRGPNDFVHRAKVCMLIDAAKSLELQESLFYLDTDMVFTSRLRTLIDAVPAGNLAMHVFEEDLLKPRSILGKKLAIALINKSFMGQSQVYTPIGKGNPSQMFNAGALLIRAPYRGLLNEVLMLSDAMYQTYAKHNIEQLAFSTVFGATSPISELKSGLVHYWPMKSIRAQISQFFEQVPDIEQQLQLLPSHFDWQTAVDSSLSWQQRPSILRKIQTLFGQQWREPSIFAV